MRLRPFWLFDDGGLVGRTDFQFAKLDDRRTQEGKDALGF
jgi:hypothetical protein